MKPTNDKKFWEVKAAAEEKVGEIYIYGCIVSDKWSDEDTTAMSFKNDLEALGDIETLNLYINSPGGSVFQAQAIFSILSRHKAQKNVYIDGLAASSASFLIMAADTIYMPENTTMMVHNPWTIAIGNANDFRKEAERLDKVNGGMVKAYMSHIGDKITENKLIELMDAETWMTAQEAFDYGFVDELIEARDVAACIDPEMFAGYKNVPDRFKNLMRGDGYQGEAEQAKRQEIVEQVKADVTELNKILRGL